MKRNLSPVLALALSWVAALWAVAVFPERIPAHWNLTGAVDRWGSKYELLIVPAVQLLLVGLLWVWPRFDPARRGEWKSWPLLVGITAWGFTLLELGILYLTRATLAGQPGELGLRGLWLGIGLFFLVIGNYLPKAPQNWVFGMRTPWTLTSRRAWAVTNRLAGWVFAALGVVLVLVALFWPGPSVAYAVLGLIGLLLASALYLTWLSYRIWREERRGA